MSNRILVIIMLAPALASSEDLTSKSVIGTINGKPLLCRDVRGQIRREAIERAKTRFAVNIAAIDVDALAQKYFEANQQEAKSTRESPSRVTYAQLAFN
jgi:hypothetical protein